MSTAITEPASGSRRGRLHRLRGTATRWVLLGLLVDAVAVLACAYYAGRTSMGMDVEFDQVSYHFPYAWALLHGTYGLFNPDPFQNHYVNPIGEVPWYLTDRLLSPRMSTVVMAMLAGINLILIRRITRRLLLDRLGEALTLALSVAAVALAGVGVIFKAELGTSFVDVMVSIPALIAVLYLVRAAADRARSSWPVLIAGAALGLAFGVKLTMTPYVAGGLVAVALLCVVWRTVRPALLFVLGGVVGTLVGGGWWFVYVWSTMGNPLFPYYNAIFKAPGYPDTDLRDVRFGALGFSDALHYPWYMWEGTKRLLDIPIRDPRWLVLVIVLALALVALVVRAARLRRWTIPLPVAVFAILFVVPGLVWLKQFGIARYAITTELMSGAVFVLAGVAVVAAFGRIRMPQVAAATALGLVGAVLMGSATMGRYQHIPFAKTRYQIDAAPLRAIPKDSTVLVDNYYGPSGFLLPSLPSGVKRHIVHNWFYGTRLLTDNLGAELKKARHIYVLENPYAATATRAGRTLPKFVGVKPDWNSCVTVKSFSPRDLCKATYVGASYHGLPPFMLKGTLKN